MFAYRFFAPAVLAIVLLASLDSPQAAAAARNSSEYRPFKFHEKYIDSTVVVRDEAGLVSPWQGNPVMSRACRKGSFKQRHQHRYIAVLNDEIYGAAIGGHAGLIDRVGLSQPRVVYVFLGQGTTNCRVYHRGQ